jgi:hypothetical protein
MVLLVPANHRFFTHFGEDHCRMSSTHSILEAPERKRSPILAAISKVLFDIPNGHRERLENLWVDELVYASAWRKHVSERIEDLKLYMRWVSQRYLRIGICMLNPFFSPNSCLHWQCKQASTRQREHQANFGINSINVLTLPYVYYTGLNKFSMMLCILDLCVSSVLLEEQRKLQGTGASTGVRALTTHVQS